MAQGIIALPIGLAASFNIVRDVIVTGEDNIHAAGTGEDVPNERVGVMVRSRTIAVRIEIKG